MRREEGRVLGARSKISGLYAVTPDEPDTGLLTAKVREALAGGAAVVQYRNKTADAALRLAQATALLKACRGHDVPLIINDHLELALEIDADGVHLGREDGAIAAARKKLGPDKILGATCHNLLETALEAQHDGASYVAFGSFFTSGVKPGAVHAPLELLRDAKKKLSVPMVAIGGVTRANAPQLIDAGADSVAVISALFDARDVKLAAQEFCGLFRQRS